MNWLLIIFILMLSGCASSGSWDTTDKALGATALAATVSDWGQTRFIAENPQRFHENNPLLGEHPSLGRVDAHFVGAIVGGYFIADALPGKYRKVFLGTVSILEISVTAHNKSIGVGWSF